jgi:hypothetical protein
MYTPKQLSSSKKLTCKGTLRQVLICLRPPPLLGFCLGWSSNFIGSESGQIHSVKLLQNMVSNRTQSSPHPTQLHTICIYCTLTKGSGGEGGGELNQEKVRGATVPALSFEEFENEHRVLNMVRHANS